MSLWEGYNQLMGLYEDMYMLNGWSQRDNHDKKEVMKGKSMA